MCEAGGSQPAGRQLSSTTSGGQNWFQCFPEKEAGVMGELLKKQMWKVLFQFSPLWNGKISQNMSTYFEKITNPWLWGGGGVNPYGQPDRKKTVIFFDDFPKECDSMLKRTIVLALVLLWLLVSGYWWALVQWLDQRFLLASPRASRDCFLCRQGVNSVALNI